MTETIELECTKDGPILVKKAGKTECALCRCGNTNKPPYCDGTHHKMGFKAEASKVEVK